MIKNLMLLLITIFFIIGVGEWLFPKFIGKLPLRLYGLVDENIRVLAQNSKKAQFPKGYIAITGDSYAVGVGDWLTKTQKGSFFNSPAYSPSHLIHEKTGIDVISFGRAGAGSFDGIWSEPVSQFLYINSIKDYKLSPPKTILIFFYEGNDVYDNIQFVRSNLLATKKEQIEKIEIKKIKDFLNTEFEKVLKRGSNSSVWNNMLFMRSILQGISNLAKEWRLSNKQPKNKGLYNKVMPEGKGAFALIDGREVQLNLAVMNGEKIGLPTHLQAPPKFGFSEFDKKLEITDKSIKLSEYIFNESVDRLASFFPRSKIKIIYIPSPISSYNIISSHIHYRGFMQEINLGKTAVVEENHINLCKKIKRYAEFRGFSFINTTKSLRQATLSNFIHGPIDWDHFNKRGYQVLSDELIGLFSIKGQGIRIDNCVH
jgi:hypothetical protein